MLLPKGAATRTREERFYQTSSVVSFGVVVISQACPETFLPGAGCNLRVVNRPTWALKQN